MLTLLFIWSALLIVAIALSTFALRWGGRVARVERPTAGRALMVVVVIHVIGLIVTALMTRMREPLSPAGTIVREAGAFLFGSVVTIMLIRRIMKASFGRAALAWLFFVGAQILLIALIIGLIRPFVSEAFVVPTNSMAPTIIGRHVKVRCPACQAEGAMIVSFPLDREQFALQRRQGMPGVCIQCGERQMRIDTPPRSAVTGGDRILVNKLVPPKRWDVAAFRTVDPPGAIFVKRLVGLPGETIFIRDGSIFVNGSKCDPPPGTRLRYTVPEHGFGFGSEDRPFKLGPDEYVMLGDFSEIAGDSRYWGPLPGVNIVGKVECRYWPPSRFGRVR
jgi:signal peptidase I